MENDCCLMDCLDDDIALDETPMVNVAAGIVNAQLSGRMSG